MLMYFNMIAIILFHITTTRFLYFLRNEVLFI